MSILLDKKILLAVTGGIAAYKSAYLVRELVKKGATVKVIMTEAAKDFVTPLTLSTLSKNPVETNFIEEDNWVNHVDLALWADLMIVAPATANTISKMASGSCDNLVLATYLSAKCPIYIAPAMDLDMYAHSSTMGNIEKLSQQGNKIIPAEHGELASGLIGKGRMAEPTDIVLYIENDILSQLPLYGKTVLISAGPTYEYIDPVRFIGNLSSGKMGYEIAEEAARLGAKTIVVSGPTNITTKNPSIQIENVTSTIDMYNSMHTYYPKADIVIMAAAVADYTPKEKSDKKIKKETNEISLELEKTVDILESLGKIKKQQFLVGFALETDNEASNAEKKLVRKNLDAIVLNSLRDKGAGFQVDTNKITIFYKKEKPISFNLKTKAEVAKDILNFIVSKTSSL